MLFALFLFVNREIVIIADKDVFESSSCSLATLKEDGELAKNYETKLDSSASVRVRGRLFKAFQHWKQLNAPEFILGVIQFGYKLPFITLPEFRVFKNNRSALVQSFVEDAINFV